MDDDMEMDLVAFMADDGDVDENENLPVAVPVGGDGPVVFHEMQRRRLRFRRRAEMMAGFFGRDDPRGGGGDDRLEGGDPHERQIIEQLEGNLPWAQQIAQPRQTCNSPVLLDMVREGLPCSSVLSGSNVRGCSTIVQRCQEHAEEVHYQCPRTGRSPLHEAALRCCCRHVIQAMTQADQDLALQLDSKQNTPLHLLFLGISNRQLEPEDMQVIVDLLLQPAPNVVGTVRNRDGCLPLHCACAAPESMVPPEIVDRLIQATPTAVGRANHKDQTPLHLHCKRRNASTVVAQRLLEAFPEAIRSRDRCEGGFTPIHYAAMNSNHGVIALLARHEPGAARSRTVMSQKSPLHVLCQQNPSGPDDLASVQLLLEAAPETASRTEQRTLYTPVHVLCRSTRGISFPIVQALIDTQPMAAGLFDLNQYLPLHHACENGADTRVIQCLLHANPGGASVRTRKNDTALSLACTANHSVETVRLLLKANPAAALQANNYGFLPLHCVCRAYQASTAIVQALVDACPEAVTRTTNAGESPIHLASSNTGASIGILEVLTRTLRSLHATNEGGRMQRRVVMQDRSLTSTAGNTPLHLACFRDFNSQHIESLAESNPCWITVRNNAGMTPLHVLCKNGRIDDRIVTLFSRLCGPEIFASVDPSGNTPLHSAMREETDVDALRAIIRAYPEALHMKTRYEDTPLHLACLRRLQPDVVREVALASSMGLETALANCNGRISPMLIRNTAGQTPIGIAMEEYQRNCQGNSFCIQADLSVDQRRGFDTVAALAKMLHYGPCNKNNKGQSLVGACVALHRKGARVDPAFILRALTLYPEEARVKDEFGNTPLHIEASIPIEKMSLLDSADTNCCPANCHKRMSVLRKLLEVYPEATQQKNVSGDFPLNLMIQNGRPWDSTFALVVRTFPEALHWVHNINVKLNPRILTRIANECGNDAVFALIKARPEFLLGR